MTSIKKLLANKQSELTCKLLADLSHSTSKGNHCEDAWINFFKSFLPSKYAVSKGFVFDYKGQMSEQIDVIIYDALYSPLIFQTEGNEIYITSESVYAVFEVKQKINKNFLDYANEKVSSVKKLVRSSRNMIVAGNLTESRSLTKILGGILATESISSEKVKDYLYEYTSLDLGCAIKNFSFINTNLENSAEKPDINFSGKDETILSFFFIILDELFKIGTVPAIDIRHYADCSLETIKLK